jgi:multidrug resistance efflux pump
MIAMKFYLLGLGLAIFFMVSVVGTALRRLLVYLWKSTETQPVRWRAVAVSLLVIVLIPAAIAAVPVPGVVVVDGIVQTEDDRVVYAQNGGFLRDVALTAGQTVHQGKTLCRLTSNLSDVELAKAGAEVELRTLQYHIQADESPIQATAAHVRLLHARDRLVQTEKMHDQLTVVAPIQGTVTQILDVDDSGRFVKKGESVATIAAGRWVVRCLVTAEQVADLRPQVGQPVRVRLVDKNVHQFSGTITEVGLRGSRKIFSPALTQLGGGDVAVNPVTLEAEIPLFELTIDIPGADPQRLRHGSRVAVRFATSAEPYGAYLHRRVRQFVNKLRIK